MAKRKKNSDAIESAAAAGSEKREVKGFSFDPLFLTAIGGFVVAALMFILGSGPIIQYSWIILGALLLVSLYFLNLHLKEKTKNKLIYGIPLLLAVQMWFSFQLTQYMSAGLGRDYLIFTGIAGLFLLFYALSFHGFMKLSTGLVLAMFASTLLTHFIPAMDIYLAEIDPHWHYKWAQLIAYNNHIPDFDNLTYPMKGGMAYYGKDIPQDRDFGMKDFYNSTSNTYAAGYDISTQRLMAALFMGSMYTAIKPLGFSIEDSAMLYPLVIGAFALVAFYVLLKHLFGDMKPYNEAAALLGMFMLFMSPIFATKAAAGNCEDDMLGMFLLISTAMFFAAAFRKKSLIHAISGGVSMLMLNITYGGYEYLLLVMGLSISLHAIASFLKGEYSARLAPYGIIIYSISQLSFLFFHRQGADMQLPNIDMGYVNLTFYGSILLSIVLEFIRSQKKGILTIDDEGIFGRIDSLVEKNIKVLGIAVIAISLVAFILIGPTSIIERFINAVVGTKVADVVGKTIAEQNPLATDLQGFMNEGYLKYGVALIYGLFMIPILLYLAFEKNSFGSAFVLSWSLPMIIGVFNKSQYLFISSVPVAALGASIGLLMALKKEELESFRIIPVIMILLVPLLYMPFVAGNMYAKMVGIRTLYVTMTDEMHLWRPSLDYLSEKTSANEAVITWWDYGHWITSISHRPVLIDNLQLDPYEIQDVARFFVLKRDQEDAMNTIRAYNNRYKEMGMNLSNVMIDWTMIGKGSAMHFIATGVIENGTEGSGMNYAQCRFLQKQSGQKMTSDKNGNPVLARQLVFGCPWPVAGILFDIVDDEITNIQVAVGDQSGGVYMIPWKTWVKDNHDSILGVQPLSDILTLGLQRPDILGSSAQWRDNNSQIHTAETYQLIYVPGEFNDYMMTRLYLGDYVDNIPSPECLKEENKNKVYCANYLNSGLFTGNISSFKPKYFKLAGDFSGSYVRVYSIEYKDNAG